MTDQRAKRFHLQRVVDATGISGTGRVAEGVRFSNGWCALAWLTAHTSCAIYKSIAEVVAIHGHGGQTRIEWEDCPGCEHPLSGHIHDNCGACDAAHCRCSTMERFPPGTTCVP